MRLRKHHVLASICLVLDPGLGPTSAEALPRRTDLPPAIPALIEQFTADRIALMRTYPLASAPERMDRLGRFYRDELHTLTALPSSH